MLKGTVDLDDSTIYPERDPAALRQRLQEFPRLLLRGWEEASSVRLPPEYAQATAILLHGMGGSAIVGDLLGDLLRTESTAPRVTVHRDYGIPSWAGPETLVVASSYSGETEEVLSGVEPMLAQGARVIAITSGGTLGRRARDRGIPICDLPPAGPPRAILPHALGALLRLLDSLGLVAPKRDEVNAAFEGLSFLQARLAPAVEESRNEAKALAHQLVGRLPVIYGARVTSAVGRRWKAQINENAKVPAFSEELPEAHHNSIVGLERQGATRDRVFAVLLDPASAPPRIRLRFDVTEVVLSRLGVPHYRVAVAGARPLEQMLGATLLGDYVSYYLALLNGVDPTPTGIIDEVKARLGER